ncbi:GNAT family N-acetyltransferase [Haloprofundus halophilus]|uniref:GNAT family N-acetyltransferase n=1 Tax=Haloprofundus halophilus TaxID=2283527 RepID=UPI000E44D4D8|nr:GNAT family N-acetyltransferase [Haloprofundus halophilus]
MSDEFPVLSASEPETIEFLLNFFNSPTIKKELHWFTHRATVERAFERDDRELFYTVNSGDNTIIGGLMVWCESRVLEPHEAQIRLVAVDLDYRDCGIGKQLCDAAEGFAKECEKKAMIADVAEKSPAVSFWHACGYKTQKKWSTKNGRPMLRVEKSL